MSAVKKHRDAALALLICLGVFLLGFFQLDNNCDWGDDFAAYMADGIAIAEGTYQEQTRLNLLLREAQTAAEAGRETHVHAFGFPLFHALVYSLAGFDRVGFDDLWLYKLPSLVFFALMAGVYYLFLRRRLVRAVSVAAAVTLCSSGVFFASMRNLHNDVLYMALSLISVFLAESLVRAAGRRKKLIATALGLTLWLSYSVRLNGITVLVTVLLFHAFELVRAKKRPDWGDALAYFDFLLLCATFNLGLFPSPTSTSGAADVTLSGFISGLGYYSKQLYDWVCSCMHSITALPLTTLFHRLAPGLELGAAAERLTALCTAVFLVLAVLGMVTELRREYHLVFYILVSFLGTAALNLGQELRYLYVILPHLVLLALAAAGRILRALPGLSRLRERAGLAGKAAVWALCLMLCLFAALPMLRSGAENMENDSRELLTAYSDDAVEMYGFISREVGAEESVAFFKPRALYLNTGRLSMLPGRNGFDILEADWYLYYKPMERMGLVTAEFELSEERLSALELVTENGEFALYRKIKKA